METLLQFLEEHRGLARGIMRTAEGRLQSQRLWGEICTTLNAMGRCTKTVQQWQRVWTDRKYLAKKNIAAAHRSALATGGGPSNAPQPSRWDLKVSQIMGEGFGEPQTSARVPAFLENLNTCQLQELAVCRNSSAEHFGSTTTYTALRRARISRRVTDDSVRSRFFRLVEERLAQGACLVNELSGIKEALLDIHRFASRIVPAAY